MKYKDIIIAAKRFRKQHIIAIIATGDIEPGEFNPDYLSRRVDLTIDGQPYSIRVDNSDLNDNGQRWATTDGKIVAKTFDVSSYVLGEAINMTVSPIRDALRASSECKTKE
jgi:hypothetical protein